MNNVGYAGQDTPFPLVFTVRGVYYDIFTGLITHSGGYAIVFLF